MNANQLAATIQDRLILPPYFAWQNSAGGYSPSRFAPDSWQYDETLPPRPATVGDVLKHIRGDVTLGAYLVSGDTTKLGVIDLDMPGTADLTPAMNHAFRLQESLQRLDVSSAVLFSGNKGYHVWTMWRRPVRAYALRKLLAEAVAVAGDAPDGVGIEIYPKQDAVNPGEFGNLIKLPFAVHRKTGRRALWVTRAGEVKNQAQFFANIPANAPSVLPEYAPPAPRKTRHSADVLVRRELLPCAVRAISEGASEGQRNWTAYRLACHFKRANIGEAEGENLITVYANNCDLPEAEAVATLRSVYRRTTGALGCEDAMLPFCDLACPIKRKSNGLRRPPEN